MECWFSVELKGGGVVGIFLKNECCFVLSIWYGRHSFMHITEEI